MSTLFDDNEEPLLDFDDMDDKDDEAFWVLRPEHGFFCNHKYVPLGLPIKVITRLTHDELTQNAEFMKYVDMVSHLQELLNLQQNPSTMANYCKTNPNVGSSASNSSRPPMQNTVRHEDGSLISDLEWQSIRQAAFTVARSHLDPLRRDPHTIPEKMHKKMFMKGAFLNEWLDAELEGQYGPQFGAEKQPFGLPLFSTLDSQSCLVILSPSFQPSHLFFPCHGFLPLYSLQCRTSPPLRAVPLSRLVQVPPSSTVCTSTVTPGARRNGKCPKANEGASGTSTVSNPVQLDSFPPAPPSCQLLQSGTASQLLPPPRQLQSKQDNATSHAKVPSTWAAKAKGNRAAAAPSKTLRSKQDNATSHAKPASGSRSVTPVEDPECQSPRWGAQVQVRLATSSFENLSKPAPPMTTRSKQDLTMSHAKAPLTCAATKAKANGAVVTNGCQSPRWGAQVQVRLVTSSFENSSEPAPSKTTHSKQDHATSSTKAPSTQVAKAKDSHSTMDNNAAAQSKPKSCLVTPAEDPRHESPDQAGMVPSSSEHSDDDDGSHSHLQVLLPDKLRHWVNEHKIESQGKWLTRMDLIKAIAGAPKSEQPSKEDIKSIINKSKSRCNTKAA
ncbi:hypothetical protein EDB92DRAFT_1949590 [Lactarius akahatsu]|uniref:Uncharacterized protein n=1 Tax=Lactarius akahatsu TaxID=416441 RepID=A0AAD4L9U8_9AGAM|nr:hypothetical protein EDB92DRAFT_1949590 [Lactarius akahatsu]